MRAKPAKPCEIQNDKAVILGGGFYKADSNDKVPHSLISGAILVSGRVLVW